MSLSIVISVNLCLLDMLVADGYPALKQSLDVPL